MHCAPSRRWRVTCFGRLGAPPPSSRPLAASGFADTRAGPSHPPGYYGAEGERRALNLTAGIDQIEPIESLPEGVERLAYGKAGETALKPWLLAAALVLALIDMLAGMALRGLLPVGFGRSAAAIGLLVLAATPAAAQAVSDSFVLKATLETRLAYILTGDERVDSVSRSGLEGLGYVLSTRTSIEPSTPMAIDIERDELIFFPLIYWPIIPSQAALSAKAAAEGFHTAVISAHHYLRPDSFFTQEFAELRDLSRTLEYEERFGYPSARQVVDVTIEWLRQHEDDSTGVQRGRGRRADAPGSARGGSSERQVS